MLTVSVEKTLRKFLTYHVRNVCRHPNVYLIVPIILTVVITPCVALLKYMSDPIELFAPTTGRALVEWDIFQKNFPKDGGFFERQTGQERFVLILFTLKNSGNDILASKKAIYEIASLDAYVRFNTTVDYNNLIWKYGDICSGYPKCFDNPFLTLVKNYERFKNGTFKMVYPYEIRRGAITQWISTLGNVTRNADNHVQSASAVLLYYTLNKHGNDVALQWERKIVKFILSNNFEYVSTDAFAAHSIEWELDRNGISVFPQYAITIFLTFVFAFFSCYQRDMALNKSIYGGTAVMSALMSTGVSYGLCIIMGCPFFLIALAIPFLLAGIGLDDSFVIISMWWQTPGSTTEERLVKAFDQCGVSITLTSLTNAISFLVGVLMPFKTLSYFCLYCMVGMVILYVFELTFHLAVLVHLANDEVNQINSFTRKPILSAPPEEKKSFIYRWFCQVGGSTDTANKWSTVFFKDIFGRFLGSRSGKVIISVIYIIFFACSIYGLTNMNHEMKLAKLLSDDSYAIPFIANKEKYFGDHSFTIQMGILEELDYANATVQSQIYSVLSQIESLSFVEKNLTEFWLTAFKSLLEQSKGKFDFDIEQGNKEDFYYILWNMFLKLRLGDRFRNDVVFNENKTSILRSRFLIRTGRVVTTEATDDMLRTLRKVVDTAPFRMALFNSYFPYAEHNSAIVGTTVETVVIQAVLIVAVLFLFIPKLKVVLWVGLSVVSVLVSVIGFMAFIGISLDTPSLVGIVICVGFSIDSCIHTTYAYVCSTQPDAVSSLKLQDAMEHVGLAIVQGAVSTLLGCCNLYFAKSYSFFTFFKIISLVITSALLHSLIFLPTTLALSDDFIHLWHKKKDVMSIQNENIEIKQKPVENGNKGQDNPSYEV